jgi:hypothetical protein
MGTLVKIDNKKHMTQLTLQDFVHSLIGTKNNSKKEFKRALNKWLIAVDIEQLNMKWDGYSIRFYCPHEFLVFTLEKNNGDYHLYLAASPTFTFWFKMTGQQLIKNKEYRIIDFYE